MRLIQATEETQWLSEIYSQNEDSPNWKKLTCSELTLGIHEVPLIEDTHILITKQTEDEFILKEGLEILSWDNENGYNNTLTSRTSYMSKFIHTQAIPDSDNIQFIDGHSLSYSMYDGIRDFGSLDKRNFKMFGVKEHLVDDSPFGSEYKCIENDVDKNIIASNSPFWYRNSENRFSSRFYSFMYKSDGVEYPIKDLVEQPFVIFSDILRESSKIIRFEIWENPDRTISYNDSYYTEDKDNASCSIKTNGTLKDGWNDIKIQFIHKDVNSIDVIIYINKEIEAADNVIFYDNSTGVFNYSTYTKDSLSYTNMKDSLVIFPKDRLKVTDICRGNVTPNGVKIAQMEFYYGIYNKEEVDFKETELVKYSVSYKPDSMIRFYKMPQTKLMVSVAENEEDLSEDFFELQDILDFHIDVIDFDESNYDIIKTRRVDFIKYKYDFENVNGRYFQFRLDMQQNDIVSTNAIFELEE
jgi:hypothetical protein